MMTRKYFLFATLAAFIMALISMYFGASIFNANDNIHVTHLNEMDNLHYYNVEDIHALTRMAVILTLPFLTSIVVLEIIIFKKSPISRVKKFALTLIIISFCLLLLSVFTLKNPVFFEFSKWGFAWVFSGLATIAANAYSVFLKR